MAHFMLKFENRTLGDAIMDLVCRIDDTNDVIKVSNTALTHGAIAAGIISCLASSGKIVTRLDIDSVDCLDNDNFLAGRLITTKSVAVIETIPAADFVRTALDLTVDFIDDLYLKAINVATLLKSGQGDTGLTDVASLYNELIWFIDLTDTLLSTLKAPLPAKACGEALKSISALIGAIDTGMAALDRPALIATLTGDFGFMLDEWRAIYVTAKHLAAANPGESTK